MKILGISSGHDSGAAIIEDGRVVVAVNEERLNRIKLFSGEPKLAVKECLRVSGIKPEDVDMIAFANVFSSGGFNFQKSYREGKTTLAKRFTDFLSYLHIMDKKWFRKFAASILRSRRQEIDMLDYLNQIGITAPHQFIEHHLCHAANAYYCSPYTKDDRTLVVTTDGSGDGLCATISIVDNNGYIIRKHETVTYHSPASAFYSNVTYNLGFTPLRHEGKVTGLAAYGDASKTIDIFRKYMQFDLAKLEYRSRLGCYGHPAAKKLARLCEGHKKEDVAAGLQLRTEEVGSALVGEAAKRYYCDKVALSGGLFANVRLNQAILELPNIKEVYIHPHMGDGGIATGAALIVWGSEQKKKNIPVWPIKLSNALLGPSFSDDDVVKALTNSKLSYGKRDFIEQDIAKLLSKGKVVARFNGKMEYGPRALCNRSILYQATDPTVNKWLNNNLHRTETMPFAPVIIFEKARDYFKKFDEAHSFASEFMTITYSVTDRCKQEAPAIVHLDNTARPQTVRQEVNPSMYKILEEYEKITGLPVMINTSFNMHEEPIVCTPSDAIRSFKQGNLDALALGNYLVLK